MATTGTVTVSAVIWVEFDHSFGNSTEVELNLANTTTDCSSDFSLAYVDGSQPTGVSVQSITLVRDFAISTPGTYTYYVNGWLYDNTGASDTVAIEKCTTVGVFYPS